MSNITDEMWDKARGMAIEGMPFKEIREALGISYTALRKRSEAEQWPTPQRVKRAVYAETKRQERQTLDDVRNEVAQRFANERSQHRERILEAVKSALSNIDPETITVKSVNDLKTLDDIQRRNLGMDLEDESNIKRINPNLYPS